MPYENKKFIVDFEACQKHGLDYQNMFKIMRSVPASDAWNLYQNTRLAPLKMQIFGRHIFDQGEAISKFVRSNKSQGFASLPHDSMIGITQTEIRNFGGVNKESSGSALKSGADDWNFTVNDVWLCAGVHALHEFHPASPLNSRNIFHQNFVLTITGRELVGLALAGYVPVAGHASLGTIFRPSITQKVEDFNLVIYLETVLSLKTVADAKNFLINKGINVG